MFKHSLLALATTTISAQAVYAAPFMPMDARGLAMGNTGVASAKRAHAPAYNPSLLSQAKEEDDFSILFPQIGLNLTDEDAVVQEAQDINDKIFPEFERLATSGNDSLNTRVDNILRSINELENINLEISSNPSLDTKKSELTNAIDQLLVKTNAIESNAAAIRTSLTDIDNTVKKLTNSLENISSHPISARLGLTGAVAIPSKSFAAAVSASGAVNISAKITMKDNDLRLLEAYAPAASGFVTKAEETTGTISDTLNTLRAEVNAAVDTTALATAANKVKQERDNLKTRANGIKTYTSGEVAALNNQPIFKNGEITGAAEDPNLSSTAEVVGVGVTDVGISFSREFEIGGEKVAFGITPKLQKIFTFHYGNEMDNFEDLDSDTIDESRRDYTAFNIDFGASYRFGEGGNWVVGAMVKNLLGGEYDYADTRVVPKNNPTAAYDLDGGTVKLNTQLRGGIAFQSDWFNAAFDLDLLKNDAVAYEAATQYASLGAEFDLLGWLQLRAGYRTNLAASNMDVVSAGFGISPFDLIHLDIAAMANPNDYEREAGVALEMGMNF